MLIVLTPQHGNVTLRQVLVLSDEQHVVLRPLRTASDLPESGSTFLRGVLVLYHPPASGHAWLLTSVLLT